ncbi:cytochrome P450 3A8-like [Littorina saxatilis]|uniref:Cytochrome P450 n=1 Tax=Littorina saxatilis TaxID=31220 RepID=A0AAN9BKF8_9CAEN
MEILGLVDIPLWLLLLLMLAALLYVYGTWTHSTWSSIGLPGPKPWPLVGNTREVMETSQFRVYSEWKQKYGKIYGFFFGVGPVLVVHDLDMLREIMVKHFNNFGDRNLVRGMRPPDIDKGLFFAGGTAWKRIRNMMTPTFSGSKLKLMSHYINRCSNLLTKNIEQKVRTDQDIDVKDVFGSYTMDVIAGTAFGLETNSQTEEGEPFVVHCKALFENMTRGGSLRSMIYFVTMFPFMGPWLGKVAVSFFYNEHALFFINAMQQMIQNRREQEPSEQKTADLLQMLVDAEADSDQITDSADQSDNTKSHRRMTKGEIIGQGFIVMIAGYETTATTLQYLTYNLTRCPEVQEKIYQEIRDNIGDEDPTYENVSTLKYLEAAIRESLRLFPPVPAIDRKALETVTINGITIPAGCGVIIPIHSLMHDPDIFPEPEKFLPERFLEENRSKLDPLAAELPFGYGPRQCIGMRLAMIEVKFAAVRIYRAFRFFKCDSTPEKINLGKAFGLAIPDVPIKVKAECRAA